MYEFKHDSAVNLDHNLINQINSIFIHSFANALRASSPLSTIIPLIYFRFRLIYMILLKTILRRI
jgi:hypothetical protein